MRTGEKQAGRPDGCPPRHRPTAAGSSGVRCNLSSWCVDKKYRGYALVLHATAVKRKDVTYVNVSPAPHTRRAIEVGQFKRFCEGQIVFAPILSASRRNVRVTTFAMEAPESALLSQGEREILAEHARLGCRAGGRWRGRGGLW